MCDTMRTCAVQRVQEHHSTRRPLQPGRTGTLAHPARGKLIDILIQVLELLGTSLGEASPGDIVRLQTETYIPAHHTCAVLSLTLLVGRLLHLLRGLRTRRNCRYCLDPQL